MPSAICVSLHLSINYLKMEKKKASLNEKNHSLAAWDRLEYSCVVHSTVLVATLRMCDDHDILSSSKRMTMAFFMELIYLLFGLYLFLLFSIFSSIIVCTKNLKMCTK